MTVPVDWVQDRLDRSPVRSLRKALYPDRSVLRKKLGISDSVIYFAELTCYPKVPPSLSRALLHEIPDKKRFHVDYLDFQKDERKKFGFIFSLEEATRHTLEDAESPVIALTTALGISRADLGKGLCLQPSLLYRHDRGLAKSLSEDFSLALSQAGLSREVIKYLDERQQKYAY